MKLDDNITIAENYKKELFKQLHVKEDELKLLNLKEELFISKILIQQDNIYYVSVVKDMRDYYKITAYNMTEGICKFETVDDYVNLLINSTHHEYEDSPDIYLDFYNICPVDIYSLKSMLMYKFQNKIFEKIVEKEPKYTVETLRASIKDSIYMKKQNGVYVKIPNATDSLTLSFPDNVNDLNELAKDGTEYSPYFKFPYELQEVNKELERFFELFTSFVPTESFNIQNVNELSNIISNNETFNEFSEMIENKSILAIALEQYSYKIQQLKYFNN